MFAKGECCIFTRIFYCKLDCKMSFLNSVSGKIATGRKTVFLFYTDMISFLVSHNVLSLLQSRLKLCAAPAQTCDCLVFHFVRTKMTNKNLTNLRKSKMEVNEAMKPDCGQNPTQGGQSCGFVGSIQNMQQDILTGSSIVFYQVKLL